MTTIGDFPSRPPQTLSQTPGSTRVAQVDPDQAAFSDLVDQQRTPPLDPSIGAVKDTSARDAKGSGEWPEHADASALDEAVASQIDLIVPSMPSPVAMPDKMAFDFLVIDDASRGAPKPPSRTPEDEATTDGIAAPVMPAAAYSTAPPTTPLLLMNAEDGAMADTAATGVATTRPGNRGAPARFIEAAAGTPTEAPEGFQKHAPFKITHSESHLVALPRVIPFPGGATSPAFDSEFANAKALGSSISPAQADPPAATAHSGLSQITEPLASPHVQIAASIIGFIRAEESPSTAAVAPNSPDKPELATSETATMAKSIQLRLHPESLGQVDVRLKMVGTGLQVQLRLDSLESLEFVRGGRIDLAHILATAGVSLDSLTIDLQRPVEAPSTTHDPAHRHSSAFGGSSGGTGSQARHDNYRQPHEPGPPDSSQEDARLAPSTHDYRAGARRFVYV